jgi:hypothetical protein
MSIPIPEGGVINIGEQHTQISLPEMFCIFAPPVGPSIMAEGWTLYAFSTIVVAARVYTQLMLTRQFGIGDVVMIGALVSQRLQKPFPIED